MPFFLDKLYSSSSSQILGIYTYTRKVALDEFENKPRKTLVSVITFDPFFSSLWTVVFYMLLPWLRSCVSVSLQGYSTVSHFNVVHYDCHSAAVK